MLPKENFHHAYFIEGEKKSVLADIELFLTKVLGMERRGHPDVHYSEHESFGIEEGRALSDMQSMKPLMGERKIFIIATPSMTSEAQNSLLKVFEEPTPGTHFFIISSSQEILLPTLRSRLVVISHPSAKNISLEKDAKDFVSMASGERLEYVGKIVEGKDKVRAESFLNALVSELHKENVKENGAVIKEILSAAKYIKDRSPSLKLILERVALLDL